MTTMRHVRITPLLLALVIPACENNGPPEPIAGYPNARAVRSCGPADGPAVAIYFHADPITTMEPPAPYVRVAIWQGITAITQQDWDVGAASTEGAAALVPSPGGFESATSGTLHIESINADSSIDGRVTLQFPAGGSLAGTFHAPWLSQAPLCGLAAGGR